MTFFFFFFFFFFYFPLIGKQGTLGKEFVFNFPTPWYTGYPPTVMVSTLSTDPVLVSVTVSGIGFYAQSTVTHEQHAEFELPKEAYLDLVDHPQNKTVMVSAAEDVSVFGMICRGVDPDGFIALPTQATGIQYRVLTYGSTYSSSYPCEFSISALQEETNVKMYLSNNQTVNITLNAHESYLVYDGINDLTGSVVEANKPISVLAGVEWAEVPDGNGGDSLLEMLPSTYSYGCKFVLSPFKDRTQGYVYRVISSTNVTTALSISGIGLVDLNAGEIYEGDVLDDIITFISSNKPISIMQFMKGFDDGMGDTAMVIVPPTEMFAGNVTFPAYGSIFSKTNCYINIVAQCSTEQGFLYDDTASVGDIETISRDGICAFRTEVKSGTHTIGHVDPSVTFSVVVYGFEHGDAFAYPAGFNALPSKFGHFLFIYFFFFGFVLFCFCICSVLFFFFVFVCLFVCLFVFFYN